MCRQNESNKPKPTSETWFLLLRSPATSVFPMWLRRCSWATGSRHLGLKHARGTAAPNQDFLKVSSSFSQQNFETWDTHGTGILLSLLWCRPEGQWPPSIWNAVYDSVKWAPTAPNPEWMFVVPSLGFSLLFYFHLVDHVESHFTLRNQWPWMHTSWFLSKYLGPNGVLVGKFFSFISFIFVFFWR